MPPRLPPMPTSTTKPSTRSQGSRPPQGRALRTALLAACLVVSAWAGTAPPPLHANLPPGPREQALRFEDEASQAEAQKDARAEALALRGAAGLYLEQTRLWRTDEGQCAHAAVGLLKRALPLFQEAKDNTGEALCQLDLGEARIAAGDRSGAKRDLDAALASFRKAGAKPQEVTALRHLARAVWDQDRARTESLLAEALRIAQGQKDRALEADCRQTLAFWAWNVERTHEGAQAQLERALDLHRSLRDRAGQAWDLALEGEVFQDLKETKKAETVWRQALELWLALPDTRQAAALLNSLGASLVDQRAFEEAKALLKQGLTLVSGSTAMDDKYRAFLLHNLGLSAQRQNHWEQARAYYDQSIQVSQTAGFLRGEYLTRSNRAELLGEAGHPQQALEAWQTLLKIKGERPASGGLSETNIRGEIIDLLVKLENKAGAMEFAKDDLALARKAGDRKREGWALYRLGGLWKQFKDPEPSLAFFDQAIQLAQSINQQALERAALEGKSTVLSQDMGRFREAVQVDQRILACCREVKDQAAICEALVWVSLDARYIDQGLAIRSAQEAWDLAQDLRDTKWQAKAGQNLLVILCQVGRNKDAIRIGKQVIEASLAVHDEASLVSAETSLANVYRVRGEILEAIALGQDAVRRSRALNSGEVRMGLILWNQGVSYASIHEPDFEKAEALYLEAQAVSRREQDWYVIRLTLHYLGHLAWAQKRPKEALDYFRQVMEMNTAHPELPPGADMRCYANLMSGLGRDDEAQSLLERAVTDQKLREDWRSLTYTLGNLGSLLDKRHQFDKAEACYRERLKICLDIQTEDSGLAHAQLTLGWNLYLQGRFSEAQKIFQAASIAFYDLGDLPGIAAAKKDLGLSELKLGQVGMGLADCRTGLALGIASEKDMGLLPFYEDLRDFHQGEGHLVFGGFLGKLAINTIQDERLTLKELEDGVQKTFLQGNVRTYKALVDLLIQQNRLSEAQQVLSMLKEDEIATFGRGEGKPECRTLKASFTGPELSWAVELTKHQARLAALVSELVPRTQTSHITESERQKAVKAELEQALKETESFLVRIEQDALSAHKSGTPILPHTESLQAKLRQLGHGAVALHYMVLPERIHIMLTTPDRLIARTVNLKEADLQKTLSDFRAVLQDDWKDPKPEGKALYDLLIAPVEADLAQAGAKTLMLSLDGGLRYIPFAALWDGQRYLVQRWATAMVAEAGQSPAQAAEAPASRFQGFGLSDQVEGFNALPAVGRELKAITAVLSGPVKLNKAFTRKSLEASLAHRPGVLHISSHFLFSPLGSAESFLVLGDGSHFSLRDIDRSPMQFSSLDLLTLSACETGVGGGKEANGLEVESLRARLQMKGAKAVLATLWPVDDDSTGAFMADFYRRWKHTKGETKAEAMRQAQVALIQGRTNGIAAPTRGGASTSEKHDWTHPYYWAPFVLSGDWR